MSGFVMLLREKHSFFLIFIIIKFSTISIFSQKMALKLVISLILGNNSELRLSINNYLKVEFI